MPACQSSAVLHSRSWNPPPPPPSCQAPWVHEYSRSIKEVKQPCHSNQTAGSSLSPAAPVGPRRLVWSEDLWAASILSRNTWQNKDNSLLWFHATFFIHKQAVGCKDMIKLRLRGGRLTFECKASAATNPSYYSYAFFSFFPFLSYAKQAGYQLKMCDKVWSSQSSLFA